MCKTWQSTDRQVARYSLIIGAEPLINGTAQHECDICIYIYIYGTTVTFRI